MKHAHPDRLPPLPPEALTPQQRSAAAALVSGPRGALRGPFVAMLRSPELLDRAQRLGEYLRYQCALPQMLREFAMLICARHWRQPYEWHAHAPLAERAGLAPHIIEMLALDRRPDPMSDAQRSLYAFCTELHRHHAVSDATYADVLALLGEQGVVDLCGVCGYYAMLAMLLNVARTPLPEGAQVPFDPPF